MPELPEVEVVRRGLDRWVTGRTVSGVDVLHARAVRRHEGNIGVDLIGEEIRCVSRRGKYLWMPLNGTGTALVAHLQSRGILITGLYRLRFVAHLDVDAEGIERTITAIREFLAP